MGVSEVGVGRSAEKRGGGGVGGGEERRTRSHDEPGSGETSAGTEQQQSC